MVQKTNNTKIAKHTFCQISGIDSFYYRRSHPSCIDVNIRCLDQDIISQFNIESFDGVNWERNVTSIQTEDQT